MQGLSTADCEFFGKVFKLFSGGEEAMSSEQMGLVMSSLGYQLEPL